MIIVGGRFRTSVPPFPHDALPRSLRLNLGEVFHRLYLIDHSPTMVVWRRMGPISFLWKTDSPPFTSYSTDNAHISDGLGQMKFGRWTCQDHLYIFVVIWMWSELLLRAPSWNVFSTKSESGCQRQAKPISLKWHGLCLDPSRENPSQRHFPSSHVLVHSRFRRSPAHILEQFYAHVWSW